MWLLIVVASCVVGVARAQAPPNSFYEGRTNDELRALASDPRNDVLLRRGAATRLVITLADEGDFDAADAAARDFAKNIDPFAVKHAQAVRRRSHVHVAALGALGASLGVAFVSLLASRRALEGAFGAVRRMGPVAMFFLANVGLVGGYVASSYENGSPLPFVLFAAFMLPLVVVLRLWGAVGSPRLAARVGRGLAAVAATLALGFLVVEQINPMYLEGFGL